MKARVTAVLTLLIFVLGVVIGAPYALGVIGSRTAANFTDSWGVTFVGTLNDSDFVGPAQIDFPSGDRYEGGLRGGGFNGSGLYVSVDGWECNGEFTQGKLTWARLFTSPAGDSYTGELKGTTPNGQGSYTSAQGWSYTGQWQQGVFQGEGEFTYANGSVYKGEFVAGLAEGEGAFTGVESWTYQGGFFGGYRQGEGRLELPDGQVFAGTWEAGLLIVEAGVDDA
jgi:hypothetical protein